MGRDTDERWDWLQGNRQKQPRGTAASPTSMTSTTATRPLFLDTIPGIDPGPFEPGAPGTEPDFDPNPAPDPDPDPLGPGTGSPDPGFPAPSPGGPSPVFN